MEHLCGTNELVWIGTIGDASGTRWALLLPISCPELAQWFNGQTARYRDVTLKTKGDEEGGRGIMYSCNSLVTEMKKWEKRDIISGRSHVAILLHQNPRLTD